MTNANFDDYDDVDLYCAENSSMLQQHAHGLNFLST